jgi:hypothetical protein
MVNHYFGRSSWPAACNKCHKKRSKHPDVFVALSPEKLKLEPTWVQNKAKAEQCEGEVHKGKSCSDCVILRVNKNKDLKLPRRTRYDETFDICVECGTEDPPWPENVLHKKGKPYPRCSNCRESHAVACSTNRKKRKKDELDNIDNETQQFCTRGEHTPPRADFQRFYLLKGRRVKVKHASKFKTCVPCSLKQSENRSNTYFRVKAEQAEEKLQALEEVRERQKTKGCCATCVFDLTVWNAYCDGRTGGGGHEETLTIRKQSLSSDWNHLDPKKKWKNVSQIMSRTRRHNEINGDPGCEILCCFCHPETTFLRWDNIPSGVRVRDRDLPERALRKRVKFIANLKWKKWKAQGDCCGNPECPMMVGLRKKFELIREKLSIYDTSHSPESLFMMFCAQFEHTNSDEKEAPMSRLARVVKNWDEDKITEEADKCTVHCNFCARLKGMESGDFRSVTLITREEASLLLDVDEFDREDDDEDEEMLFLYL